MQRERETKERSKEGRERTSEQGEKGNERRRQECGGRKGRRRGRGRQGGEEEGNAGVSLKSGPPCGFTESGTFSSALERNHSDRLYSRQHEAHQLTEVTTSRNRY
ncbi:hypothetical protein EYF80_042610 [Liparis tanakae]|uniref:Uncharacterized protein n=1 Tax=Liparis tanakae TaxID=230148 RepID=A0A4Z2G269_9TELE|nr:hypothetical protein EYF80_042610 [Liparis tanakae]